MRIGRFSFGIIRPSSWWGDRAWWGYMKAACGCHILDLGRIYLTWFHPDCKCSVCKKHICECVK